MKNEDFPLTPIWHLGVLRFLALEARRR